MISIVIPLYDKATQVKETLDSVRQQVFAAYELIIVDDGSTDGSPEVVQDYLLEHPLFAGRVRLLRQPHAGVSAARNRGIRESVFEWIALLDADDTWSPEYLQTQYALSLKYPGATVLAAGYGFRRGAGPLEPAKISRLSFPGPDGILDNYFEVAASSHPPLCSIVTIVRRQALRDVGGFPEGISSGEDLLTWARLAIIGPIAYTKKRLGIYNQDPARFNTDQRKRMPDKNDRVGECLNDLFRRHADVPGLRAYMGSWYKMRTRIYLTHSMRKEAWREWRKLVRFTPVRYKTWVYFFLLVSPVKIL